MTRLIPSLIAIHSLALAQVTTKPQAVHARVEFQFTVSLAYAETFPLFGAWAEQKWSPGWKPEFLYPSPAADEEGAVFRVNHGAHSSVWIMTRFDPLNGRVQYAHVMDNLVMTRIDIEVKKFEAGKTGVLVTYEWTALSTEADDHVRALPSQFGHAAEEWGRQLNDYAASLK